MTIIEASAVVTAAALTAMALTGLASHVTKILLMKKAEAEFEKLKTGLHLGTQMGAGAGAILGAAFDYFLGTPQRKAETVKDFKKAASDILKDQATEKK